MKHIEATKHEATAHYGIIDPDYARIFTIARCLGWSEGYALAIHGSFTRDLDMIAVPWTDAACSPEKLVTRIADAADLAINGDPGQKPHGRLAFTLLFKGFSDPRFIDLSVMPRPSASKPLTDERVIELKREVERLNAIINTPQSNNFLRAVSTEAEHQRQRWGSEHDAGKAPSDWFWLIGYLAGKGLHSHAGGNIEKAEHHIITTAAVCANWHRAMFGKTDMRPGIDAEAAYGIKGDA